MSVYTLQATFARGEITPRLHSRADIDHWPMSLKECRNFFVMRQGGLVKRLGTVFAAEVKDSSKRTRLMPFVFSTEQAYIVEMGHQYFRYYANGGRVGGGSPVETATDYLESEIFSIQYAQSADTAYLAHEKHPPASLTRTGATTFAWGDITFVAEPTTPNDDDPPVDVDDWSTDNYPRCVAFYNQRLCFASTPNKPQTLWLSKEGILLDFGPVSSPAVADDAIKITILSGEVNAIQWLAEGQDLLIGTTGAARTLGPSDRGSPFSATNLVQKRHSKRGAAPIQPVQIGNVALFVSRFGTKIHEYLYSFEADGYIAPELTVLSDHLFKQGVVQMAYAQDPESIVWIVLETGVLVALTYDREQQIIGITPHDLGGHVESVATIPGDSADEVWLIVRREINGQTKRFVEYFHPEFEDTDDPNTAFFVDCGLTYSGEPVTSVSGLGHLEGETVTILADGAVVPPQVVVDGAISLPAGLEASTIHVGLPFQARIRTLPSAISMGDGSGLHRPKKVASAIVDVLASGQVKLRGVAGETELSHYRTGGDNMDEALPLRTGPLEVPLDTSWESSGEIELISDQPTPCTLRSLTLNLESAP